MGRKGEKAKMKGEERKRASKDERNSGTLEKKKRKRDTNYKSV